MHTATETHATGHACCATHAASVDTPPVHSRGFAEEYTCPMHPEIRQPGPGTCPKCGMALEPTVASVSLEPNPELLDMSRRFWVSAGFTLPVFALAMADMLPGRPLDSWISPTANVWSQLALATPVVVWGGAPFFQRGIQSIRTRELNMFTLIALGVVAAYGFSLISLLVPSLLPHAMRHAAAHVYFEASAVIVTLTLLGQVLELHARGATAGAVRALIGLSPKTARKVLDDGTENEIDVEDIAVDDRLRVRPGDKIPVDGVVVEGHSVVDESMLTGESMPIEKALDAPLTGGTLNGTGTLIMRATRVGEGTLLAQIVATVGEAQRSRAPIQRLADRVSAWFVPAVIAIAVVTGVVWSAWGPEPRLGYALANAVAVLIVACPCALGLATPMSIMVGTGRAAQAGVLMRNAQAIELMDRVDTLVIDKTGTLTEGKPWLAEIVSAPGFDDATVLAFAASLEQASEHPLAAAVMNGAVERGLSVPAASSFLSIVGRGVVGRAQGREIALGNQALLTALHIDSELLSERADRLRGEGHTVVFVAIDGVLAGLLGLKDRVKVSAAPMIETLKELGLHVVMLTGDNATTADAVARQLGIDTAYSGVLPVEKGEVVARLQREGRVVAMAGDGTNDAPALARADVGIAMGTGTDVAIQSAGITLLSGDLGGIVRARRLARAVMSNIRQNLFFSFAYNALGVPVAAGLAYPFFGLLLNPMIGSAAMALSSVSVIGNALRLRRVGV